MPSAPQEVVALIKVFQILKDGTLMQIVHFQLKYYAYYPTFRNLISDILVFLKK